MARRENALNVDLLLIDGDVRFGCIEFYASCVHLRRFGGNYPAAVMANDFSGVVTKATQLSSGPDCA